MKSNRFKKKLPLFLAACVIFVSLAASKAPVLAESNFEYGVITKTYQGTAPVRVTSVAGRVASSLPAAVDLTGCNTPEVQHQVGNSCGGYAVAYAKTFEEVKEIGWSAANSPKHVFSPNYIWNQLNRGGNNGISLEDALDLVINQGCATLDNMPFSNTDYSQTPSQAARDQASRFKASSWEYLTSLNDIKATLAGGDPVIWGMVAYRSFELLDSQNFVFTGRGPSDEWKGGHAICIVGYDDSMCNGTGAFKVMNSWGSDWGEDGYAWVSYNLLFDRNYSLITRWETPGDYTDYFRIYKLNDSDDELIPVNNATDLATDDVAIFKNYTNYLKYRRSDPSYSTSLYMQSYPDTGYNYSKMVATYYPSIDIYKFTPIVSTIGTNDFSGFDNVYSRANDSWRALLGVNASGLGDMRYYASLSSNNWYLTPSDASGNPGGTGYFKLGIPPPANTPGNTSYMSSNFSFDANYNCTPFFAWKIFKY